MHCIKYTYFNYFKNFIIETIITFYNKHILFIFYNFNICILNTYNLPKIFLQPAFNITYSLLFHTTLFSALLKHYTCLFIITKLFQLIIIFFFLSLHWTYSLVRMKRQSYPCHQWQMTKTMQSIVISHNKCSTCTISIKLYIFLICFV